MKRVKTMKGCNYIKRMIDEADKADLLSFEINEHVGRCADCEQFANERTALRGLLASERRVSAPKNFDAMLKARLVEVKARNTFSWFSAPGFMRLGAATAGVVIMILVSQYTGLFSSNTNRSSVAQKAVPTLPLSPLPATAEPQPRSAAPMLAESVSNGARTRNVSSQSVRGGRVVDRGRTAPESHLTAEDGGIVLVRGGNGEMDVPMPTVSVGAQPLLYVSAGQRPVRSAANSF